MVRVAYICKEYSQYEEDWNVKFVTLDQDKAMDWERKQTPTEIRGWINTLLSYDPLHGERWVSVVEYIE